MILITKGPAPKSLEEAKSQTEEDLEIHEEHGSKTSIRSSAKDGKKKKEEGVIYISALYRANDVKVALVRSHAGKCAYCETQILTISHGDVEHFRPKSEYTSGASKDKGLGYFWLAYNWENLLLACQMCNETHKGTYFELMPGVEGLIPKTDRMDVGTEVSDSTEFAVLINPELENPRYFVEFNPDTGVLEARRTDAFSVDAARVGKMVQALGLNRPSLVAARQRYAVFLRSLFINAIQDLPANPLHQELLAHTLRQLEKLKGLRKVGDARGLHAELEGHCKRVYLHEGPLRSGGAPNPAEAMKWLHFCATPRAEYTGLAHDCLLAWGRELRTSLQSVTATTQTTSQPSLGHGSHTTTHDMSWPPLFLPPVKHHLQRLEAAEQEFVKRKEAELEESREALREYYYNEVNAVVVAFNAFQKKFVSVEAEDRYLEWFIELDHCNDRIEELGGASSRSDREMLLKLLDGELTKIAQGQLGPLELRLKQFRQEHMKYFETLKKLHPHWRELLQAFEEAGFLLDEMLPVMRAPSKQSFGEPPPTAYSLPAGLAQFHQKWGPELAALSPGLKRRTERLRERVEALQEAYGKLDDSRRRGALTTLGQPAQRCQAWMLRILGVVKKLEEGLGAALREAFDRREPHLAQGEQLMQGFSEAGLDSGDWRREQANELRTVTLDLEEAMNNASPTLVPEDPSKWGRPLPLFTPPAPPVYSPAKLPLQAWTITTAKSQVEKFWADRKKLKNPNRKLTAKQQKTIDELTQRERQLRAAYQKLITFTEGESFVPGA